MLQCIERYNTKHHVWLKENCTKAALSVIALVLVTGQYDATINVLSVN